MKFYIHFSILLFLFTIHLFSQTPGTQKWEFQIGNWVNSPAIGSDGTIYVGSLDDTLYAINPDGTKKWEFPAGVGIPVVGPDGTIYARTIYSHLYALNPDGTVKWEFPAGGFPLAISPDNTIYINRYDSLFAIDTDATIMWTFPLRPFGEIIAPPAIGSDGTIYIAAGRLPSFCYAINPDGSLKWRFQAYATIPGLAIGSDGTVYIGTSFLDFIAINPDGTQKWIFYAEGSVRGSPAIGSDGTIYFRSGLDNFYAINPDGTQKWLIEINNSGSTPAVGLDGTIYIGSVDYNLYAINPDGTEKWKFLTPGVIESSPAISSDGTVYVGSYSGQLYAIYSESMGLAASSWPKFQANNMNQGTVLNVSSIEDSNFINIVRSYKLIQNYPNPFNPSTKIKYSIPEMSFVTLKVYDVLGNEIATLVNEEKPTGSYEIEFEASKLSSGIYFYKLQAGTFVETKKMILMK